MKSENAARSQMLLIERDGFSCQQVQRNCITRKSIDREQVESLLRLLMDGTDVPKFRLAPPD